MSRALLLDFGTTSTKSALLELDDGRLTAIRSHASIPGSGARPGRSEVPLEAIRAGFDAVCCLYADRLDLPFDAILLCSEMHGFAVLDAAGRPLTPYVGWRDERALEPVDGVSTLELFAGPEARFRETVGMDPRPGLALLNLAHLGRTGELSGAGRVVSLPGWLARGAGEPPGREHPTLLAAMGAFDVRRGEPATDLLRRLREVSGLELTFGEPAAEDEVAGYWRHGGRRVPVYVGVGDHQTSVLGAGLTDGEALSLNLGTGSQASVLGSGPAAAEIEERPYFAGRQLATVTAVPAGRALEQHVRFLDEVAGGTRDVWALLAAVRAEEALAGDLEFDLRLFPGAFRYAGGGGGIAGLREGRLNLDNYLASLLRSFAAQYAAVGRLLDPEHGLRRCLLGGGIARRLPALARLVEHFTGYATCPAAGVDESLVGLAAIALVAAGRAADCLAARRQLDVRQLTGSGH